MTAMSSPLRGATAVVTGATGGIGRAVARRLAEGGARVALLARRREPLEALAREIDGWAVPCDVTDADGVGRAAAGVVERAGRPPRVVVAAAGVFDLEPVHEMGLEAIERNLSVNLLGGILTVRAFLPHLREAGEGTIVQVGSVAGRRAMPGNAAYSASKYGIRGFHEVLLDELRGSGVRATLLEPAATDTPIWDPSDPDGSPHLPDRKEMLAPGDVADAILFAVTRPPRVQIPFLPVERS